MFSLYRVAVASLRLPHDSGPVQNRRRVDARRPPSHEALAVSEALYLCEQGQVDVIVIGPNVDDPDPSRRNYHHITLHLKPEATAKDVIWELSKLFPDRGSI